MQHAAQKSVVKQTRSPAVGEIADRRLLVVSDLKGHSRSMIFMSSERPYAISC